MGLNIGSVFLPAFKPKLRAIIIIWRPSWNPNKQIPEVQTNDFIGFLDPQNVGLDIKITFPSALVFEL